MSDEREFDELRAAWNELEAPSPPEPDARTRATVDWLAAAYRHLDPPTPVLPAWARARRRRRRVAGLFGAFAAAAALLALAFGAHMLFERVAPSQTEVASEPSSRESLAHVTEAPIEPRAPVVHAAFRSDGVELRSGKVRLILLDAPRAEPSYTPTKNPKEPENAR